MTKQISICVCVYICRYVNKGMHTSIYKHSFPLVNTCAEQSGAVLLPAFVMRGAERGGEGMVWRV